MLAHAEAVLALAGQGPRRWQWLQERDASAAVLAASAVRDRSCGRLSALPQARAQARAVLGQVQAWLQAGLAVGGWLGYEVGAALEGLAPQPSLHALPDYDLVAFDPRDLQPALLPAPGAPSLPLPLPASLLSQQASFEAQVQDALARIAAGEIYQVNLSVAAEVDAPGLMQQDAGALLAAAQAAQAVPYGLLMRGDGYALLSGSMERFLTVQAGLVRSRPIKGTAPRSRDAALDQCHAAYLMGSEKERAENTMIVDMVRNDLGRVAERGSVTVPILLACEPYATLWHLESEVQARLAQPADVARWLEATLPPASVTGCPKVQAMRVIAALEGRRRGPYCGAAGLWLPDGRADLSVGIRQLVLRAGTAQLSVGAGIVADSDPGREWSEVCLKAGSALGLLGALRGCRDAEAP